MADGLSPGTAPAGPAYTELIPRPDPSKLTDEAIARATTQYRRELDALRTLLAERIQTEIAARDSAVDSLRGVWSALHDVLDQRITGQGAALDRHLAHVDEITDRITESRRTDLAALRELMETRLGSMDRATELLARDMREVPSVLEERLKGLQALIGARIDAIDRATTLKLAETDKLPGMTTEQIDQLRKLHEERFSSIAQQFAERDVRTNQAQQASDQALNAALQAAKELVNAQGEASSAAAVKSETSFALALDTPIFTGDGWKTMGTVKAGDIAFAEDGEPTSVIATSGIFLGSSCYSVQFSDGSRIVATGDHRWHVYDVRAWQGKWGVWKTMTTQEIVDSGWHRLRSGGNGYRYRVATNAVVQTPEVKLPIDPYIFGYWLGDGSSGSPTITVGNEDREFVTAQIEDAGYRIAKETEQVSDWGTSWALYLTNDERRGAGLYALLGQLGVRGSGRKHVPDLYLAASPDQRRALLAGLLDSDGTISKAASRVTFNSTSTPLAEGVRQVARSLGYRAVLHRYGDNYHVTWPPIENVFRNPRKVALFRPSTTRRREWASITDVQPTPAVPTRCLTVEHPSHVFLVGRGFIPTCNTKQIDQIGTIISTLEKALDARITELKERIDRGEGSQSGQATVVDTSRYDATFQQAGQIAQQAAQRASISQVIAALAVLATVVSLILYIAKKLTWEDGQAQDDVEAEDPAAPVVQPPPSAAVPAGGMVVAAEPQAPRAR